MAFTERIIFINLFNTIINHNGPLILQNLLLISLQLEAVFTTLLHDQFTGLSLAMQRINGNGDSTNIKHFNQFAQRQNLTASFATFGDTKA